MCADEHQTISTYRAWGMAARPKTLPAAAAPVIVGSAIAFADGRFVWLPALAALLSALLLQVGSNVANDLFDYQRGADRGERLGPTRVTQAGILTPAEVRRGMVVIFGLAALIGVYLVLHAGWPILIVGLAAILSAIAYTGGPFPLGYHGLGDLFVFLFFGLAATAGTYYVQAGTVSALAWGLSVCMGLLIVAILVVNNLRDIAGDARAGKRTLAVILGVRGTQIEYTVCIAGAYLVPVLLWNQGIMPPGGLLVLLSVPLAWRWSKVIFSDTGRALNKALAGTGQLTLIYALLFSFGILMVR